MSVLGTIIIAAITAGLTYFGTTQFTNQMSGPVQMSPEIKTYVDAKLTGTAGNSGQELQKIVGRVAEMEAKLTEMEKVRASYEQLAGKSELIESAIGEQRKRKEDVMAAARMAELSQLRNDIATVCAGVTIKRVQSNSATGKSGSAEAAAFRNNIGVGRGAGRPGASGGQQQGQPAWMQQQGKGGGGRGGRRGGGGGGQNGGGNSGGGSAPATPPGG